VLVRRGVPVHLSINQIRMSNVAVRISCIGEVPHIGIQRRPALR